MKKVLIAVAVLVFGLMVAGAFASPFLVCDPQAGVDYYTVSGLPASMTGYNSIPAHNATYGFKYDLATLPAGTWTVKANACKNATATWPAGVCSADSAPLDLIRPSAPTGVGGLKVIK